MNMKKSKASGGDSRTRQRAPEAPLKMLKAVGGSTVSSDIKAWFADFDITNWKSQ
jgi:hypothetical protein